MEIYLRRLMERKVRIDLYLALTGEWWKNLTLRSVSDTYLELVVDPKPGALPEMWRTTAFIAARQTLPETNQPK